MNTVKCHCGFDSGIQHPTGGFNVGDLADKLKMVWIALQDGGSTWICHECAGKASKAADLITEIVGSDKWIASSVRRTHKTNQR
jgi:hypothetical protein